MARIIIAEDDEIVRDIVRNALTSAGHFVGEAENGADALRAIKAKAPDLVILDCNMPELNGLLVLREIRNSGELYDRPSLCSLVGKARGTSTWPTTKAPMTT